MCISSLSPKAWEHIWVLMVQVPVWKPANWGLKKFDDQSKSKGGKEINVRVQAFRSEEFLLTQPFSSIQVFTWLNDTHSHYGGQSSLLSLLVNANLIQKHIHRNTQKNIWPNVWASYGLSKLTFKINHHTEYFCYCFMNSCLLFTVLAHTDNHLTSPSNMSWLLFVNWKKRITKHHFRRIY